MNQSLIITGLLKGKVLLTFVPKPWGPGADCPSCPPSLPLVRTALESGPTFRSVFQSSGSLKQVITYSCVRKKWGGGLSLCPSSPSCSDGPGEWSHFQVCLLVIRIIQVITYSSVRKSSEGKISVVRMLNESHKSPNQRQLLRSHALNVQTCRTDSTLDNVLIFQKNVKLIFRKAKNHTKDWEVKKVTHFFSIICLLKSSENILILFRAFYLIMWFMKSPKKFEKITILKI